MIRLNRIRNEFIRGNLGVMNLVRRIRKNVLRWFGHSERENNEDIVKKIDEIGLEGNWGRGKPQKK